MLHPVEGELDRRSSDRIGERLDLRRSSFAKLARATYRKMVQNLWWATGYNLLAIPLAAGVLASISPAAGALLMLLPTVIVAVNARWLRLSD